MNASQTNQNPVAGGATEFSRDYLKRQVRRLFLEGGTYTAKQLNQIVGFNDARKVISTLRAEGLLIKDVRLENKCKLYWLEQKPEPTLFDCDRK